METKEPVNIDINELRSAYEEKLSIAVQALQKIAILEEGQALTIATNALEEMKDKDDAPLKGITYKFIRIENRDSRYEIDDSVYNTVWSVLLTPKERGDLINAIKDKVRKSRALYDQSTSTSD